MTRGRGAVRRGPTPALADKMRRDREATVGAVLAWLAALFAIVPHWFLGACFLGRDWFRHPLWSFVTQDVRWALALVTTLAGPLWFWWWRRSAMSSGALVGTFISLSSIASVALCAVTVEPLSAGTLDDLQASIPVLILAGVVSTLAFRIAPQPADPEVLSELQVRGLLRQTRHASAAAFPPATDREARDDRNPGAPGAIEAAHRRRQRNVERGCASLLL